MIVRDVGDESGIVSTDESVANILDRPDFWGTTGLVADKKNKEGAKVPSASTGGRKGRSGRTAESHVANALRSAYEEAVKEDVPSEFLDLLGKLS